jgi:peptide/nickel transport system substrate-binding protein
MAMLYFNELLTDTVPFAEPKVRQGLLYSLDRQALIDQFLMGQAIIPETPLLPGTWAYDTEDVPTYPYDPELALQRFDQAGWVRSDDGSLRSRMGQPLRFSLLVADEPQDVALGQAIADQWARQGISVTIEAVPPLVRNGALESRDYEAALVHLMLPGDPDPYPFWHETQYLTGQNYAGFRHRRISEIIEAARITINREERLQLYREFQQLFMEEVPALPLYVPAYTHAVDVRTQGVQIGPLASTGDRFRNIADWYVLQRRVIVSEQD